MTKVSEPASKTLHQLVTKKYLDDLKAGESWIHTARRTEEELECIYKKGHTAERGSPESDDWGKGEDEFDEILKQEGERIGAQWGVVGERTVRGDKSRTEGIGPSVLHRSRREASH